MPAQLHFPILLHLLARAARSTLDVLNIAHPERVCEPVDQCAQQRTEVSGLLLRESWFAWYDLWYRGTNYHDYFPVDRMVQRPGGRACRGFPWKTCPAAAMEPRDVTHDHRYACPCLSLFSARPSLLLHSFMQCRAADRQACRCLGAQWAGPLAAPAMLSPL